ncbi:MAG: hypothetical protein KatS3mg008_0815 [Acidimicrobiales bacterium]|nr:MAG: hypothetical protein KatS3mg008_0815 [Acidimicrobiales bacterium]
MAFRFFRRVRLAPGLTLNLSKSGPSLSIGPRGAKITVGPRGTRLTAGIPGTGLFYTVTPGRGGGRRPGGRREGGDAGRVGDPAGPDLDLGLFERLVMSDEEEAFVDGLKALSGGDVESALGFLERAGDHPDVYCVAGIAHLQCGDPAAAATALERALSDPARVGERLARMGVGTLGFLMVTEEIVAPLWPDAVSASLALVEAYQSTGRWDMAAGLLESLLGELADDPVLLLSLVEIYTDTVPEDEGFLRRVLELTTGVDNESAVHAALLLHRARAFIGLGLHEAALETLTAALRRKAGRPPELLRAIRYERAGVYEKLGRRKSAQRDLERIYADDPGYEDVAARLGLI